MNLYAHDLSLMDFNDFSFSDPFSDSFSRRRTPLYSEPETAPRHNDNDATDARGNYGNKSSIRRSRSPPKYRHDGTSPLPLGMDWSPPPRKWVLYLFGFWFLCIFFVLFMLLWKPSYEVLNFFI